MYKYVNKILTQFFFFAMKTKPKRPFESPGHTFKISRKNLQKLNGIW